MAKLKIVLAFTATMIATVAFSYPCNKYVFDLGDQVMPGRIVIRWSINTGFNRCGLEKDEIRDQHFAIKVETLFGELLLRDTVNANYYGLNTSLAGSATPFVFSFQEVGDSERSVMVIIPREKELPRLSSKIDTLNNYLINGYFLNAMSILYELERPDLIDSILTEHQRLFPRNYPGSTSFLNCYFDERSMALIRMPYVQGLDDFTNSINKMTKRDPKTSEGFTVYMTLSPDNQILEQAVLPEKYKNLFDLNSDWLTFSNPNNVPSNVVLKVGRSKNGNRFSILNERALMDQNSPDFRRTYPIRGHAIH